LRRGQEYKISGVSGRPEHNKRILKSQTAKSYPKCPRLEEKKKKRSPQAQRNMVDC